MIGTKGEVISTGNPKHISVKIKRITRKAKESPASQSNNNFGLKLKLFTERALFSHVFSLTQYYFNFCHCGFRWMTWSVLYVQMDGN